jgi:hypothetical protein
LLIFTCRQASTWVRAVPVTPKPIRRLAHWQKLEPRLAFMSKWK